MMDNQKAIEQLEDSEVIVCNRIASKYKSALAKSIEALYEVEALRVELERTKREWDAAVRDIYSMAACDTCKHYDANDNVCAKPMVESYKCFEWRGVQADHQA